MVFADAVVSYVQAGWPCVLPVPTDTKFPPPVDFHEDGTRTSYTGQSAIDPSPEKYIQWIDKVPNHSVALRMPLGIIGIDVDHYDKVSMVTDPETGELVEKVVQKRGGDQLAALEAKLGPLPATWRSSSRAAPSGIMFFRVPEGRYRTKLGDSIEIIQFHHRYAVVAPSVHETKQPDAFNAPSGPYAWSFYSESAKATVSFTYGPPHGPASLTELPEAWVAYLREGATEAGPEAADVSSGHAMLYAITSDDRTECADVTEARDRARRLMTEADSGSRHDTATERTHHLINLGASGHPGVGPALTELSGLWNELTAGEGREEEWDRMLLTSARKAVTAIGGCEPVGADPCLMVGGFEVPAPAPDTSTMEGDVNSPTENVSEDLEALDPPRFWSPRQVIGAHAFDPAGMLDHTLADSVLERTWPALRYAVDAGTWLLRGPELWEPRGDLTRWAVHELASMMPHGDPDAEKGSPEQLQAARRKMLMSTSGRNSIGATMTAAVAAGTHPCSVTLADLDTQAYILWAGGTAWDLRRSIDGPVPGDVEPGVPHLHSAATAPELRDTPLWDRFLAAVWPDEDERRWVLRVLSVPFTGYPRKFLPILWGEQDTGKTAVVMILMSVLGTYAHAADVRLLSAGESHASIVYALKGRRLSFIDEGPRTGQWAAERLKALSGGGELTGNRMRENPVTFRATHKLVLTANNAPPLSDEAVRSRVRLIPCRGNVVDVRRAREALGDLGSRAWRHEAPGILAKMMVEAARWIHDEASAATSAAPSSIQGEAEEIGQDQDPVRQWREAQTVEDHDGTQASILHEDFVSWCRRHEVKSIPSLTAWGQSLNRQGCPVHRIVNGKRQRPLRLLPPAGWSPLGPVRSPLPAEAAQVEGQVRVGRGSEAQPSTKINMSIHQGRVGLEKILVEGSEGIRGGNDHILNKAHIQYTPTSAGEAGDFTQTLYHDPQKVALASTNATESAVRQPSTNPLPAAPAQLTLLSVTESEEKPKRAARGSKLTDEEKAARKEAATAKRQAAAREKRAAALAEAAGPSVALPALVDREGLIISMAVAEAAREVRTATERSGALTVDVESSGRPVGHRDYALRTVQLGDAFSAVDFDPTDPAQADAIRQLLAEAPMLHAFSAAADLVPLIVAGLADESIWDRMHDVVIPAKLADPQSTGSDAEGLKGLAGDVLGEIAVSPAANKARGEMFKAGGWLTDVETDTPLERNGWAQVDLHSSTMVRYATSDVLDTAALALKLPWPSAPLLERERTAAEMTSRITFRGIKLDAEQVARLKVEHTAKRQDAADRVKVGGVSSPGSKKELADKLISLGLDLPRTKPTTRFPQGQPSVAKDVLNGLARTEGPWSELLTAVLDYRKADTSLGLFLEPYWDLIQNGDGRARPTIYTLAADTGRMSGARPNPQQVTQTGGFRACWMADPGYRGIGADFSGVELRVLAGLSGCVDLKRYIEEEDSATEAEQAHGVGLHWAIAREVWGPNATKANRYQAKRGVFGKFYGAGIPKLAATLGVSEAVATSIVEMLDALAPGAARWSNSIQQAVRRGQTQFPTYAGRIVHLDPAFPHKAPNYCIQGSARELLVDALMKWRDTRWGNATLLPVHDELIVMVPEAEAVEATAELVRCMESELYGVKIKVEADDPWVSWPDAA